MPLVTTAELLHRAAENGSGVAAFNVITLEHAEGIVAGAQHAGTPVILQVSENSVAFHGTLRPISERPPRKTNNRTPMAALNSRLPRKRVSGLFSSPALDAMLLTVTP